MEISLHPEAKKSFDLLATNLKPSIRQPPNSNIPEGASQSSSTDRPTVRIDFSQIKDARFGASRSDDLGFELDRYLQVRDLWVGLDESSFASFKDLVLRLAQRQELRDILSVRFVDETVFDWVIKSFQGDSSLPASPVDYLLTRARQHINRRKIMIPVSFMHIEGPFTIGKAQFEFLSKGFWDDYEAKARVKFAGPPEALEKIMQKNRRKYQGVVVASTEVEADFEKAVEVAIAATDRALMILRTFSPSVFLLKIPSYFGKMGDTFVPITHIICEDDKGVGITERAEEERTLDILIRNKDLEKARASGLDVASELIAREPRNDLEEALLAAMSSFSKAIATNDYHDRLVFLLASIETLLLKDASEPIQTSIGARLAFLSETSADGRMEIVRIVKRGYERRSRYLHHGILMPGPEARADLELVRELQSRIWIAISRVLRAREELTSRADLAEYIQHRMFTGS